MSSFGDVAKGVFNSITEGGNTERLTFRKYNGHALAKAAELGTEIKSKDVETVSLKVNPEELSYTQPKITQKVQTSAPGQFVVFDWGTDLLTINIAGNTGNLLPGIVQSGFDPTAGVVEDLANTFDPGGTAQNGVGKINEAVGSVMPYAQNILLSKLNYHDLLEMSAKYRTFEKLRKIYKEYDADLDVLTLEAGNAVYRGYFNEFSFTQTAANPWNWKYSIIFTALSNLTEQVRRGDDSFPEDANIIDTTE